MGDIVSVTVQPGYYWARRLFRAYGPDPCIVEVDRWGYVWIHGVDRAFDRSDFTDWLGPLTPESST